MIASCRYFAFSGEQDVDVSDIKWHSDRRAITVNGLTIPLTLTEYSLLWPLRDGQPMTYASLARVAYSYTLDSKIRTMMDKHVDRIRGKLRGTGIYIYCVLGYGYMLLPEIVADEILSR